MTRDAHEHLAAFAESRDERAFARVVDEFGGLVFAAALRRTGGDFELSEEIAQNVFAITARKARRLSTHPSRSAWFYTTTRFEAAKALQSERRHQRKVKALAREAQAHVGGAESADECWRSALPILDVCLDRLAPKEREVLLGRFFEGRTFREIALATGSTEAACKMRLKRSLGRLSGWLSGRGVTLSAAALASGLAAEFSRAAPETVATSITPTAIDAAVGLSPAAIAASTFATMSATKAFSLGAIIAIVFCAIPIAIQQSAVSDLKAQLSAEQSKTPLAKSEPPKRIDKPAETERAGVAAAKPVQAEPASIGEGELPTAMETLVQIYTGSHQGALRAAHPRVQGMLKQLEDFSPEELFAACREVEDAKRRRAYADFAINFLAAGEPLKCIEFIRSEPAKEQAELMHTLFRQWAKAKPADAMVWFLENQFGEGPLLGNAKTRNYFSEFLAYRMIQGDQREMAIDFASELVGRQRKEAALYGMLGTMPTDQLEAFAAEVLERTDDVLVRRIALEKVGAKLAKAGLEAGKEWALAVGDGEGPAASAAALEGVARAWMKMERVAAAEWWLQQGDPADREHIYSEIVASWARSEPNACGRWLAAQPDDQPLDLARASFARAVQEQDLQSATTWANSIADEALRQTVLRELR